VVKILTTVNAYCVAKTLKGLSVEKVGSNALRAAAGHRMNVQELATMKRIINTCTRCVFSSQVAPAKQTTN
jgi:hypothetical protein